MILYRILTSIVTVFCLFFAMSALPLFFFALTNPQALLNCFITISFVLYGWFANRFFITSIVLKKTITKKQKDWLQVNAIVVFVVSVIVVVFTVLYFFSNQIQEELFKSLPADPEITKEHLTQAMYLVVTIFAVFLLHVIWTYLLVRKHKEVISE